MRTNLTLAEKIIIWTNYDWLESPMLHTKFHDNKPTDSAAEDFWRVFTYGIAAIFVIWPKSY